VNGNQNANSAPRGKFGSTRERLGACWPSKRGLSIFQEATRKYPDLGSTHMALAEVAASLGHSQMALAAAEAAVRVDPERAYFWMRLGQELQRAGRLAAAIESMEAALTREPTNANYHAALAAARLNVPDDLEKAKADPRHPEICTYGTTL
jgi:tetratricopeptide (TPR) repeat protein